MSEGAILFGIVDRSFYPLKARPLREAKPVGSRVSGQRVMYLLFDRLCDLIWFLALQSERGPWEDCVAFVESLGLLYGWVDDVGVCPWYGR